MRHFVGFVLALNEAAKGRKLSDRVHESPPVQALLEVGRAPTDPLSPMRTSSCPHFACGDNVHIVRLQS